MKRLNSVRKTQIVPIAVIQAKRRRTTRISKFLAKYWRLSWRKSRRVYWRRISRSKMDLRLSMKSTVIWLICNLKPGMTSVSVWSNKHSIMSLSRRRWIRCRVWSTIWPIVRLAIRRIISRKFRMSHLRRVFRSKTIVAIDVVLLSFCHWILLKLFIVLPILFIEWIINRPTGRSSYWIWKWNSLNLSRVKNWRRLLTTIIISFSISISIDWVVHFLKTWCIKSTINWKGFIKLVQKRRKTVNWTIFTVETNRLLDSRK